MNEVLSTIRLWSDFDGTAVEKLNVKNPRHWARNSLKYPLKPIPGYADFLQGAWTRGVEIAGIVSRRPNVAPRRWATQRSIASLGLGHYFAKPGQVVLAGSEMGKAAFVASQSLEGPVAIIDDQPHKVGEWLLVHLREQNISGADSRAHITLGVVGTSRSPEYVDRLWTHAKSIPDVLVGPSYGDGFRAMGEGYKLDVIPLWPYSTQAGRHFAGQITPQNQ